MPDNFKHFVFYQRLLICLALILLSACNSNNIRDIADVVRSKDPVKQAGQVIENKGREIATNPQSLPAEIRALKTKIAKFKGLIDSIWGKDNASESGPKDYVKYTDDYYNRAHIDFDEGYVSVETLAPKEQRAYLKKAIVTTLLTPDDPRKVDLYSDRTPEESNGKPFLYEQVLDQDGKAIAWAWRANRFADYLIQHKLENIKLGKRQGLRVRFSLIAAHQQIRSYKYASLVRKYSDKYKVTESLIYSVIKTESSFNPFAVSHAPAYGLMQIVPSTAGRDVFEKVKKRSGQPDPQYLYNPENNIDTGTAYLKILQEQYLAKIRDQNAKRYSVISAYNGGAGNVFKTFSSRRDNAIDRINALSAEQVYKALSTKQPSQESRHYLYKVTQAQKEFWQNKGFKKPE